MRLRDVFIDVSMFRDIGCVCNAMRVRGIAELHRCGRGRLDQGYLLLKGNDVIIRNLNIAKIPGIRNRFWDSTDGKLGNWNSEFDGLAV